MRPGRLLLADRHLGILGATHGLLRDLFQTVVMVADERSLAEALVALAPDLVVVDLSLPGAQEADLVGRLLAAHPVLRVVVMSAHDEPEIADRLLGAGATGLVLKRCAGTDLLPAVRAALAGDTYVSQALRNE